MNISKHKYKNIYYFQGCVPHFCFLVDQRNHQILQSYIYLLNPGYIIGAPPPKRSVRRCSHHHPLVSHHVPITPTESESPMGWDSTFKKNIAGMTPMILPGFFQFFSFLMPIMPIMLCHVGLPKYLKWSHIFGQSSKSWPASPPPWRVDQRQRFDSCDSPTSGPGRSCGRSTWAASPRESWAGKSSKNAGWLAILTSFIVMIIYDNYNPHHKVRVLQSLGLAINQLLFCLTVQVGRF